jgi:general secretion pathway protein G
MLKRLKTDESGMTLIELTIVIVILGLLAGLVAPRLVGVLGGAKNSTAEIEIRMFKNALNRYAIDVGDYPASEEGLRALWKAPDTGSENWEGPYIEDPKFRDPWGNDYVYTYPGNHEGYPFDLYSLGKDGKESEDDLKSWMEDTE